MTRRLEAERRRGDLETELQIMQDDRARLAVELDGAVARLPASRRRPSDIGRRVSAPSERSATCSAGAADAERGR